jgi:hypothetical protein
VTKRARRPALFSPTREIRQIPFGTLYATGLRHLVSGRDVMEKNSRQSNRSGKRVVRDLPLSDAATPGVKRGFIAASQVFNALAAGLSTMAKKL